MVVRPRDGKITRIGRIFWSQGSLARIRMVRGFCADFPVACDSVAAKRSRIACATAQSRRNAGAKPQQPH